CGARLVEPIEQVALAEQVAFRRVDVLRAQGVVLVELPCLESAHAAARVGQREEEPPHEVVVPAPVHEPGRRQLVALESLRRGRPRQRRAAGRESDPELLRDRLTEPARREVRSEEHTSELQSRGHLVCRLLLEKKKYTGAVPRTRSRTRTW